MAAIPSLLQPGDAPFADRQPVDREAWSWLVSLLFHAAIILLLLLFVMFKPDEGMQADKPIAITYVPAEAPDELPPGAEGASNMEAASGAPAPPQVPVPSPQPQPVQAPPVQAAPVQAAPVLSVPVLPIAPFMTPMQTPMTIVKPRPAPIPEPGPSTASMAPPEMSDLPPSGQGGNDATGNGTGNGSGAGQGIGNSPSAGPGLGGMGSGPGRGGHGGGNEVQYVLLEFDTMAARRVANAAMQDFIQRLTDQCGLIAIQTNDPNWRVEVKVTYGPDGKLMNLQTVEPARAPNADYRAAAATLLSALSNPACNYLAFPAVDSGRVHIGTIYLYPLGSTMAPPSSRLGRPASPYGSGYSH